MEYEISNMVGKIIHADCSDVLKQLGDQSVDLILTDPPYGIHDKITNRWGDVSNGRRFAAMYSLNEWDKVKPDSALFSEMLRISQNQIVWGGNYFTSCLPVSRGWLAWDKQQPCPSYSQVELAWTSYDKPASLFRGLSPRERCHPTQKPVPLFQWCLKLCSQPNDIVLDPFAGSGTTALACHALGRRFICIEREIEYVNVARNRLRDAQAQLSLFDQGENSTGGNSENSVQQMQAKI